MNFHTINARLSAAVLLCCAGLLTACGGDNDKKEPNDYSSISSSSSSSSSLNSSTPASSSSSNAAVSSSLSSSSVIAATPPVALASTQLNSADGNYFVAQGEVAIALPEDAGNTRFKDQRINRDGFALYTFAKDVKGVSNCSGNCLANWPPLLAGANDKATSPYSIIERSLGNGVNARQWVYQGLPLYFFKNDTAAGQTNGKAITNWQLARPIPVAVQQHTTKGEFFIGQGNLVNSQGTTEQSKIGFTLYTFAKDIANQSNCGSTCIANWPPLYAANDAQSAGDFSVVTRSDSSKQWAYKGQPLYFYTGDSAAGEINGEIPNWSLATVAIGSAATSSSTSSSIATISSSYSSSSTGYSY